MALLSLLRHAKAAQPVVGQHDFDRPLTERGRGDAAWVGAILSGLEPDLALVSAARRTRDTWEIAGHDITSLPVIALEQTLYLCSAAKLIARLREIPPSARSVVVVGHNPCMQEVAAWLALRSKGPAASAMREKFPTTALAIFDIHDGGWSRLAPEGVTLRRFITPRMAD